MCGGCHAHMGLTPAAWRLVVFPELAKFDGKDGRDLYLAVNGDVFDMFSHESGRDLYGPDSPYHVFGGRCVLIGLTPAARYAVCRVKSRVAVCLCWQ